jgi:hypothetical protein
MRRQDRALGRKLSWRQLGYNLITSVRALRRCTEEVCAMRIQTGQLVSLGYGRYVRSDEIVAVEPITEGRGPGRRCLVWVRGVPDPIVASRSQAAIIEDMVTPAETIAGAPPGAIRGVVPRKARPAPPSRAVAAKAPARARKARPTRTRRPRSG